ncbi:hypothetical protein BGZ61DRAFT_237620 [Ilyonectria robusta]|uniref:uncharacterized protein n=1 Tax=Ilyonectria robusta TaxID=1079257 RepID=UPI001E8CB1A7|nr:uncharacterized protein BGZ61DRAFT_237620 [Ilyonectria robusta]KAH8699809.1 hypothetical protein BGZ61DRAFT_237620 [Ilyonectria robusta]
MSTTTSPLSINAFPAWARLNDVQFDTTQLDETEGKGLGLVAKDSLTTRTTTTTTTTTATTAPATTTATAPTDVANVSTQGNGDVGENPRTLLRIPHDLVLSAAAVKEYANVDQNFRQLLEVAGQQSTRHDIMLYLMTHLIMSTRGHTGPRGCASSPWTEYVKFLPRFIPIPTMWAEDERALLQGTSLEAALEAKLSTLTREFDDLREKSSALAFWNSLFWEKDTATRQDWILADAWYRSRCLELPRAGDAMVPALDMVNHSHRPTAYYEEDDQDGVVLILRPGVEVTGGEEVTITYGEAKSAAEMLFSYGFIDPDSAAHELVLPLDSMPDDPLGKAKLHAFEGRPTLKLSRTDASLQWSSPFAYFMCLNEEDGLDFGVLQDTDGERQLRLFWQEEDVTGRAHEFETLIEGHPLQQVFKLRVVAVLHELVSTQLMHLGSDFSLDQLEPLRRSGQVREECIRAAGALRQLEASVLEIAAERLDEQMAFVNRDRLAEFPHRMAATPADAWQLPQIPHPQHSPQTYRAPPHLTVAHGNGQAKNRGGREQYLSLSRFARFAHLLLS